MPTQSKIESSVMTRSRSLSAVVTVESLCSRGHIPVFVSCVQQPNALIIASCSESHSNTQISLTMIVL
jgi:hypothetical protein